MRTRWRRWRGYRLRSANRPSCSDLLDHLKALETSLHLPALRRDTAMLDALLHPDFREIGRSGKAYSRAEALAALSQEADPPAAVAVDFQGRSLGEGCVLLTYTSAQRGPGGELDHPTARVSIWVKAGAEWRILFHQGTPCAAFEPPH